VFSRGIVAANYATGDEVMPAYLHDGILLYLDRLADWEQYYTLAQGEHSDVASEREALRGVLETTA